MNATRSNVMGVFAYLGFEPAKATVSHIGPDDGPRAGMASFAQLERLRALWAEYTRHEGTPDGLNTWMLRNAGTRKWVCKNPQKAPPDSVERVLAERLKHPTLRLDRLSRPLGFASNAKADAMHASE